MSITTPKARQLTTASEFTLFSKSLSRSVKNLSEAQVRVAIGRARKLRDKYRQMADRQEREVRGKVDARRRRPSAGNLGTREKMRLFEETLGRYEARLAGLAGASMAGVKKAVRAPGKKTKARSKKKATTRKKKVAAKKKATPKKKVAAKKKATTAKKKTTRKTPALGAWTTGKPAAARKPKAKRTSRPASKVRKTGAKTEGSVKRVQRQQTTKMSRQKHAAARGRRSQAKRDAHGR